MLRFVLLCVWLYTHGCVHLCFDAHIPSQTEVLTNSSALTLCYDRSRSLALSLSLFRSLSRSLALARSLCILSVLCLRIKEQALHDKAHLAKALERAATSSGLKEVTIWPYLKI